MDKSEVIDILKKYKKLLAQYMVFEELILYGSYAKETALIKYETSTWWLKYLRPS